MKILILGASGFLGTHLTKAWSQDPKAVITLLDPSKPTPHSERFYLSESRALIQYVSGSILDQSLLNELIPGQDIIYNLAAQTSHTVSLTNPLQDTQINTIGALRLLETARLLNPKAAIVYPSTTTVIGRSTEPILDEHHPENPLDIYSANKSVAEKYHQIYYSIHGLRTFILRFANIYGPFGKHASRFGFINHFIHQAVQDSKIAIYGTGAQTRNVLYAGDAAELLKNTPFQRQLVGQLLNATSPYHCSVREIAETIVQIFGTGYLAYQSWPKHRKKIEINNVRFSSEKLRALTGWQAPTTLSEGLCLTRRLMEKSLGPQALK